jgi:ribonucleoside-diphosphate reductase alpha chain
MIQLFSYYDNPHTITLLKSRKILKENETVYDLFHRVISALMQQEDQFFTSQEKKKELENEFAEALSNRIIVLGSPLLTNAGISHQPLSACTVIPIDLSKTMKELTGLLFPYYQANIGSGFNFSKLSNPIEKIKQINDYFSSIDHLLERPACGMATLKVNNSNIEPFVSMKWKENFSKWRFNLSVEVNEDFMQAVKSDKVWVLQNQKQIRAKDLFHKMIQGAHICGEPGIVFMDKYEKDNPVPSMPYESVSPCAEIALAAGEVCQFGYINVNALVQERRQFDFLKLEKNVILLTRMLDNAVEISIKNAVSSPEKIAAKRKIGIGILGFAELLLTLKIPYDSLEAENLLLRIMAVVNFASKKASVELKNERGVFDLFAKSRYTDIAWVGRFKAFPTQEVSLEKWEYLEKEIVKGIRNAGTTALPPTGVSSRIVQASASIEPLFSLLGSDRAILPIVQDYLKKDWEINHIDIASQNEILQAIQSCGYLPDSCPKVSSELRKVLQVAKQIPPLNQIRMMACAQRHTDEGIAKTINCNHETSIETMEQIALEAYEMDLKGITFFRDRCLEERDLS